MNRKLLLSVHVSARTSIAILKVTSKCFGQIALYSVQQLTCPTDQNISDQKISSFAPGQNGAGKWLEEAPDSGGRWSARLGLQS